MGRQLKLFHNRTEALSPDCFLSGNPDFPDEQAYNYIYWPEREVYAKKLQAELIGKSVTKKLVLCEPVEDGWTMAEVIPIEPDDSVA